ncbi:MAG TPA: IclR family transcriptional regulator [Firmicutes bacterium]|jgi:DNA-binding IclR family transcriptional regulator|nr:IclR family transcriptional regulator [Bacillota bacterium]
MISKKTTAIGTKSNLSTEKVFAIIEYLANQQEPVKLRDIAHDLNMNPSTTLRFISSLENLGYVIQNSSTLKYALTMKICSIAHKVVLNNNIRELASPFLKSLSRIYGESSCIAIEHEMQVVYIDTQEGPDQMLTTMKRIGNVAPMHCTGVGKLLLLNYNNADLTRYVAIKGLPKLTENTITTLPALKEELQKINKQGYAFDNEECEIGARCIAVPIRDYTTRVVAAMSVMGPIFRMDDNKIFENLPYLLDASVQLSKSLGYEEERQSL